MFLMGYAVYVRNSNLTRLLFWRHHEFRYEHKDKHLMRSQLLQAYNESYGLYRIML